MSSPPYDPSILTYSSPSRHSSNPWDLSQSYTSDLQDSFVSKSELARIFNRLNQFESLLRDVMSKIESLEKKKSGEAV
jgi:hypothetical protein